MTGIHNAQRCNKFDAFATMIPLVFLFTDQHFKSVRAGRYDRSSQEQFWVNSGCVVNDSSLVQCSATFLKPSLNCLLKSNGLEPSGKATSRCWRFGQFWANFKHCDGLESRQTVTEHRFVSGDWTELITVSQTAGYDVTFSRCRQLSNREVNLYHKHTNSWKSPSTPILEVSLKRCARSVKTSDLFPPAIR